MTAEQERILAFLTRWRDRLLTKKHELRTDEEFGQLICLNTVINYVENM